MDSRGEYEIGITSGWYSIAKSTELLGLAQKIGAVATTGANYIQVDFENTSEFVEPDVIDRIRQTIESLRVKWGAHGEIGELMGWEGAIEVIWLQSHRRLHQYLDGLYDYFIKGRNQREGKDYSKFKPEYMNFHASNLHPIGLFVEKFRYGGHVQMDFNGNPDWGNLMSDPKNERLKRWFQRNLMYQIYARDTGQMFFSEEGIEGLFMRLHLEKKFGVEVEGDLSEESLKSKKEEVEKERKAVEEAFKNKDEGKMNEVLDNAFDKWLSFSALRRIRGMISEEEWAYALVAKYLEFRKDDPSEPLWNMFFKGRSMEDLEAEWGGKGKSLKLFDRERGVVNLLPEIVAMVATRYIVGHFKQPASPEMIQERRLEYKKKNMDWDEFYEWDALKKLNRVGVIFSFETPDVIENQREGLQRIIHAKHIHMLVKALGSKYVKGWIDSEHYLHNGFDPVAEFRACDEKAFEDFIGFHVGSPKPYAPGHDLIDVGSEAQRWIYVYAYEMRKRGFGLKDKGIIIFERGGGRGGGNMPANYLGQSVTAIRLIVDELKKDTPPEKLPLSFYGVSPEGVNSVERQMAIVKEHYWDPLKGMLSVPEEDYTFFSKAALDKGKKPDEFKKEELR